MCDMVMRSTYLPTTQDMELRQLAFEYGVSVSALIREAISSSLVEWRERGGPPALAEAGDVRQADGGCGGQQ